MGKFFNVKELEEQIHRELKEYTTLTVEMPISNEEYESRFNLKNDEINIDEVKFGDIKEDIFSLTVHIPNTNKEFKKRFEL